MSQNKVQVQVRLQEGEGHTRVPAGVSRGWQDSEGLSRGREGSAGVGGIGGYQPAPLAALIYFELCCCSTYLDPQFYFCFALLVVFPPHQFSLLNLFEASKLLWCTQTQT